MNAREGLVCPNCGYTTSIPPSLWTCPNCSTPLQLEALLQGRGWHASPRFSLGEGRAPLLKLPHNRSWTLAVLEHLNPTGSFKDLGTAAVVGDMLRRGVRRGVVDSSGNSAISFSYYAKAAGLEPVVIVPRDAPSGKLTLIRASGAQLVTAESREEASKRAREMALVEGVYYAGHTLNPHFTRGLAVRTHAVLRRTRACERGRGAIVVPLSSGSLALGAYYALKRLVGEGLCDYEDANVWGVIPYCNARAYKSRVRMVELASGGGCSLLDALRIPRPPRLGEVIEALSRGGLLLVDDNLARKAWKKALSSGLLVEPSSAVVLPAMDWLAVEGGFDWVIGVFTGSGLKYFNRMVGEVV